jgi:hypothetical protein
MDLGLGLGSFMFLMVLVASEQKQSHTSGSMPSGFMVRIPSAYIGVFMSVHVDENVLGADSGPSTDLVALS